MVIGSRERRHVVVLLLGLLLAVASGALCGRAAGAVAARSVASAAGSVHGAQVASSAVHAVAQADDQAAVHGDARSHVHVAAGAAPSCGKGHGDLPGTLPVVSAASQQDLVPSVLPACLTPESQAWSDAAYARPPVRGPTPLGPPTPAELSVLRV
ncbi:hypothetical protein ACIQU6_20690 [Streptomyces sp. NPDC090442]|uniref:hypothetical protein n=1 Tax=Streptomyces sp. NPDC090442 TaxID=3365962 RepID=UPI0038285572